MADFALVVGVGRYPGLPSDPDTSADLAGPDHDAQAVYDWLIDPAGGALAEENVRLIRSADFPAADPVYGPQPAEGMIHAALNRLEERTREVPGGRLYLYLSGHGFAPSLEEGALFTAEATAESPSYIYAHAWLKWFRRAQAFREFVLWMDCCMNYQQSIPVRDVPMRPRLGTGVPGPAFIAIAAQTKSALEYTMRDGNVHGVFTWTLLQGLRGGAADERARVTSNSLKTFLHNAMPEFLPASQRKSALVDLQPFVRADDGIVFRKFKARPKHRVHLSIPEAVAGSDLRIWTGRPHVNMLTARLDGPAWTGDLVRGLYMAEVPASGLRQGFQVTGSGDVEASITEIGPPVRPSDGSEICALDIVAGNAAGSITVTDFRFDRVFTETGELHENDVPGVYKVRIDFGRDITRSSERILLLDGETVARLDAPQLPSPAPIPGSALTHESHVAPFAAAASRNSAAFSKPHAGTTAISVLSRYWSQESRWTPSASTFPHPLEGLQLLAPDGTYVADLAAECKVHDSAGADPVALWERELAPGIYYLRQVLPDGRTFDGAVVAAADWTTQVAIRRANTDIAPAEHAAHVNAIGDVAIFMRRADGGQRPSDQDEVIEAARLALADGRNLFGQGRGASLQELLLATYDDPVARIIGAHLLLIAMDASPQANIERAPLFDAVVGHLRTMVVMDHPDVEALSLRCADPALRASRPFTAPPMFHRSWQLMTEASHERLSLLPPELWGRVHASTHAGVFFVWASDERTRAAHAEQLTRWMTATSVVGEPSHTSAAAARAGSRGGLPTSSFALRDAKPPASLREAAQRSNIPACALDKLWKGRSSAPSGASNHRRARVRADQ